SRRGELAPAAWPWRQLFQVGEHAVEVRGPCVGAEQVGDLRVTDCLAAEHDGSVTQVAPYGSDHTAGDSTSATDSTTSKRAPTTGCCATSARPKPSPCVGSGQAVLAGATHQVG